MRLQVTNNDVDKLLLQAYSETAANKQWMKLWTNRCTERHTDVQMALDVWGNVQTYGRHMNTPQCTDSQTYPDA